MFGYGMDQVLDIIQIIRVFYQMKFRHIFYNLLISQLIPENPSKIKNYVLLKYSLFVITFFSNLRLQRHLEYPLSSKVHTPRPLQVIFSQILSTSISQNEPLYPEMHEQITVELGRIMHSPPFKHVHGTIDFSQSFPVKPSF